MNEVARINNPFDNRTTGTAMAETVQSREVAGIQAAMVIAKRFPRDPIAAMDRILNACTRPGLAEGSLYSYNRGGAEVTGPSIRLAEAIAQNWGNMEFGIRELEQANGESTVEAFAFDLETNTRQVKIFQVPHIRYTKSGKKKLEDPRDIYELVANQGARRLRSCILGVIPGDVVEAARDQCEVTLQTHAEVTTETIKKMVEAFAKFGVTVDMIQKKLGKRIDAINAANMIQLIKIRQGIKDGISKPEDWFEMNTSSVSDINERLRQQAEHPVVDTTTGEIAEPAKTDEPVEHFAELRANPNYSDWCTAADDCKTVGELAKLINSMDQETKATMRDFLKSRQDEIKSAGAAK